MTTSDDPKPPREEIGHRVSSGARTRGDFTYSVIETGLPRYGLGDRRDEDRTRLHLREGVVAERPGKVLVECRIRDLSPRGARLYLDKDQPLPRAFLLTEAGTRRSFRAVLAWQVGRDAGVRLIPIE